MTADEARALLTITVLDFQDVRDRYKAETYQTLLTRAFALVGVKADGVPEPRAKTILTRAHRAAVNRGLYASPILPAQAAAAVLRAATRGARS